MIYINNHITEQEQDWSTHQEQTSDPLLQYLGYPAKYSILDTKTCSLPSDGKQPTSRTENIQWHFPVYPVWDCKCSLSYSYTDNSTASTLHSRSIILEALFQIMLLSAVTFFSKDLLTCVNACKSLFVCNGKHNFLESGTNFHRRIPATQLPLNSVLNLQSTCTVPSSVMSCT